MIDPLLSLEGTWEEISARVPDFADRKLRVLVFPAEARDATTSDTRPIAQVLAEIAATVPPAERAELPPDFVDQLDHYIYGAPQTMKQVFADTFYWVASITPGDAWHEPTLQAAATLGTVQLVTTEEVLVEFLSAYAGRGEFLRGKAVETVRAILANVSVIVLPQSHESFLAGLDKYAGRPDKGYSLVDCISMHTMRQKGITEVLTNDHHFSQEGFTILVTR